MFLLGKRPRPDKPLAAVPTLLEKQGFAVAVLLQNSPGFWRDLATKPPRLVIHRGLRMDILAGLEPLENDGWRFCNPVAASLAVLDRRVLAQRLRASRLPTPASWIAASWEEACRAVGSGRAVVKALDGAVGRGLGVLCVEPGCWPDPPPFPAPLVVEERVEHDGIDRKLYVIGNTCRGLLKRWPRQIGVDAHLFDPGDELSDLARAVGTALGLQFYGVDVVIGPDGPLIVDVNLFPSFKGIAGAEALIAEHVARQAEPGDGRGS